MLEPVKSFVATNATRETSLLGVGLAVLGAIQQSGVDVLQYIPEDWRGAATTALGLLILVLRNIKRKKETENVQGTV